MKVFPARLFPGDTSTQTPARHTGSLECQHHYSYVRQVSNLKFLKQWHCGDKLSALRGTVCTAMRGRTPQEVRVIIKLKIAELLNTYSAAGRMITLVILPLGEPASSFMDPLNSDLGYVFGRSSR